jgi:hypothetical protein
MANLGISAVIGFILALLFASVMGISSAAVLITDYMHPGRIMSDQARTTLILCAVAGFLAALFAWWLQSFASERGFVIRFLYALITYTLSFGAIGGLLVVASNFILNPAHQDFGLSGLYGASVGGFYTFMLFIGVPLRIGLAGLLLAAGLIIAIVGPRHVPAPK